MARPKREPQQQTQEPAPPAPQTPQEPLRATVPIPAEVEAYEIKRYIPHPDLAVSGEDIQKKRAEVAHRNANVSGQTPHELGLECKNCGSLFIYTSKTERKLGIVRRRRKCQKCQYAWYTVERPEEGEEKETEEAV
jgi:hypothetical protein